MHAVILAGGNIGEEKSFNSNKALINFNGIPMIQHVIRALQESEHIDKIMVIGNNNELEGVIGEQVDIIMEDQQSMIDNLVVAANYFSKEKQILVSTCDIPLLRGEMITDFIEAGLQTQKELIYPIVEKGVCLNIFPDVKRTYVSLQNGIFTGGNLVLLNPAAIKKIEAVARLIVKHRKNPLEMSKVLGFKFLFLLLIRRLTLQDIEKHIEKSFNVGVKALINQYPEVGNDVDRFEDVAILEKYI